MKKSSVCVLIGFIGLVALIIFLVYVLFINPVAPTPDWLSVLFQWGFVPHRFLIAISIIGFGLGIFFKIKEK